MDTFTLVIILNPGRVHGSTLMNAFIQGYLYNYMSIHKINFPAWLYSTYIIILFELVSGHFKASKNALTNSKVIRV